MKKVLIITYYWIPSGGAGVQRWVKFTKYLREFGWEPIIYTPENADYAIIDSSFEQDIPKDITVLKHKIWEPYGLFRKLSGKKAKSMQAGFINENKQSNWKDKLAIWIRGNFLIPDPRVFWVRPSIRFLSKYLRINHIDAVVSTGPPHSMHLIAAGLKKKFPALKWIADFRDPWTNIDFYKDLNLSFIADKIHHGLEKEIIQSADAVVVVSPEMKKEYQRLDPKQIHTITNGYDSDDIPKEFVPLDQAFSISHTGTLNAARNPETLWQALSELSQEMPEFQSALNIQLIGAVDYAVLAAIEKYGLTAQMVKIDYLPHAEAIAKQQSSQLLLLLVNRSANAKGILTGKFFEYLAVGRPIIAIGPCDGDLAQIMKETAAGTTVDFEDKDKLKSSISHYFKQYQQEGIISQSKNIEQYSRRNLTDELSKLLDELSSSTT